MVDRRGMSGTHEIAASPQSTHADASDRTLERVCGQLVVGGFEGTALPETFARALAAGERGGAVLFARNLTQDLMQCAELTRAIAAASARELPPLIAIDQEGGRVARLRAPVLALPPMAAFGQFALSSNIDVESRREARALAHDAARALPRSSRRSASPWTSPLSST